MPTFICTLTVDASDLAEAECRVRGVIPLGYHHGVRIIAGPVFAACDKEIEPCKSEDFTKE